MERIECWFLLYIIKSWHFPLRNSSRTEIFWVPNWSSKLYSWRLVSKSLLNFPLFSIICLVARKIWRKWREIGVLFENFVFYCSLLVSWQPDWGYWNWIRVFVESLIDLIWFDLKCVACAQINGFGSWVVFALCCLLNLFGCWENMGEW